LSGVIEAIGRNSDFWGHVLTRLRAADGLSLEGQTRALGLAAVEDLARLALCRLPRPDQRAEDLAAVATNVGLTVQVLEDLLRRASQVGPE
jgi:hypothetical protein